MSFRIPRRALPGETLFSDRMTYVNGGKAANQAIGAAKLGAQASIITAIGRDPMGDVVLTTLRDHGVDVAGVAIIDDAPTMVGALMIEPGGENSIVVAAGALTALSAAIVRSRSELIQSSSLCLVSLEIPLAAASQALVLAREHGVRAILNPAPASDPDGIAALLEYCDIVTPNETEARALTGESMPARQAAALLELGARAVVITLGSRGALVQVRGETAASVPAPAVRVVDTSGAGDAFNAALAVALTRGTDLCDAVQFGCQAAALIVQAPAFVEALHMWDDLDGAG